MIAVAIDDVGDRVAERRNDAHRQHEQRKRHDRVGDAADDPVGPAAEIAGGQPEQRCRRTKASATAATAMPRSSRVATTTRLKDIAAELVGAEPMCQPMAAVSACAVSLASGS